MNDVGKKVKGFFDRPEGTTGMIFIAIAVLAVLVAGNTIMPWVITALQNTIHAAVLGGVLLGGVALVMNKKFRFLCASMFKSAMRAITGIFITIDPIGILKNYIEEMQEKLRDIDANIGKLNGQKNKLASTITEENRNSEQAARMASVAKKQGNMQAVSQNMRKAARSKEFVGKLQVTKEKMEFLSTILMRMRNSVSFLLEDTKDEVRIKEAEYKSIKAAHKAMKGAEALVQGDAAKELFEQSCEFIAEDIANKMGEMETFMELSEDFMTNVDLQNGVWDEKGLEMLENWEKTGELLNYETKRSEEPGLKVRVATTANTDTFPEYQPEEHQPSETKQQFASFFDKK